MGPAVGDTSVPSRHRRGRRALRLILVALLALAAAAVAGFLWWAQPQPLLSEAEAALRTDSEVVFERGDDGRLTFRPAADEPTTGLILYTGGKVPPAAYAPAARAIAAAGYLVVLPPAPFHFAIFGIDAAGPVIQDHPSITSWAVGGHSLGGAAAALYVDGHEGEIDGLVLWASYSSADISEDGVLVSSAYGTLDRGATTFTDPENLARLGPAVVVTPIEGGNHEQMGWYTGQPDDPPATIARQQQQDQIVAATLELLAALDEPPLE